MPIKIAINTCYGGFGLSVEACLLRAAYSGNTEHGTESHPNIEERADPHLVRVVEELGAAASGSCSSLKVVEIPDGVDWTICDYDGIEWVAEKHRTWC